MMKRVSLLIIMLLCLSQMLCATIWQNRNLYEYKTYGNENVMIKMVSNYKSVSPNNQFIVQVCFSVKNGWNTYSSKESDTHQPLSLSLNLPQGVSIVDEKWSEPTIEKSDDGEPNEIYRGEFYVTYLLEYDSISEHATDIKITAPVSWQCCNSTLCTMGEDMLSLELNVGKMIKSKVFKDIHID